MTVWLTSPAVAGESLEAVYTSHAHFRYCDVHLQMKSRSGLELAITAFNLFKSVHYAIRIGLYTSLCDHDPESHTVAVPVFSAIVLVVFPTFAARNLSLHPDFTLHCCCLARMQVLHHKWFCVPPMFTDGLVQCVFVLCSALQLVPFTVASLAFAGHVVQSTADLPCIGCIACQHKRGNSNPWVMGRATS